MTVTASLAHALGLAQQGGGTLASASGGAVNIDFDLTFVGQMVVFTVLFVVLRPLLFDPVLALFEERERRTDGARTSAREMQEKAGELLRRYEQEIKKVQRVAAEERDRVRAETARLEAEELRAAREVTEKVVADGRARIQEEVHAIRFELGQNAERLARDIAGRVLGREVA